MSSVQNLSLIPLNPSWFIGIPLLDYEIIPNILGSIIQNTVDYDDNILDTLLYQNIPNILDDFYHHQPTGVWVTLHPWQATYHPRPHSDLDGAVLGSTALLGLPGERSTNVNKPTRSGTKKIPINDIKHGSAKSPVNVGVDGKITYFYGPFSSTPCSIAGG